MMHFHREKGKGVAGKPGTEPDLLMYVAHR